MQGLVQDEMGGGRKWSSAQSEPHYVGPHSASGVPGCPLLLTHPAFAPWSQMWVRPGHPHSGQLSGPHPPTSWQWPSLQGMPFSLPSLHRQDSPSVVPPQAALCCSEPGCGQLLSAVSSTGSHSQPRLGKACSHHALGIQAFPRAKPFQFLSLVVRHMQGAAGEGQEPQILKGLPMSTLTALSKCSHSYSHVTKRSPWPGHPTRAEFKMINTDGPQASEKMPNITNS